MKDIMKARHAVRSYTDQRITGDTAEQLKKCVDECNCDSGLHIQLCLDEPAAFSGFMAHYGKFNNVKNYIALIGEKAKDRDEKIGYYGEKIVLKAQELGLNTCWVAMSYSKGKCAAKIGKGEKLVCVLALGYGSTQGTAHKSKPVAELAQSVDSAPDWYQAGVEAAALAPTAMNQQKFSFSYSGNTVFAKPGSGFYTKVDLGIAKYHFELGAGKENFKWG